MPLLRSYCRRYISRMAKHVPDVATNQLVEDELVERVRLWFRRAGAQLDQGFPDEANLRIRFYFDDSKRVVTLTEHLNRHEVVRPLKG